MIKELTTWWASKRCRYLPWVYLNRYFDQIKLVGTEPIVLDASCDPCNLEHVLQVAKTLPSHIVILVNDRKFAAQCSNLRFFPTWIAHYAEYGTHQSIAFTQPRQYHVSCLNRMPRLHRFYTYYLLNQCDWINEAFISFGGFNPVENLYGDSFNLFDIETELGIASWFENRLDQFPITAEKGYAWTNCHNPLSPAYSNSLLNIDTETSIDIFCPTEKTTKALAAGNLLVPIASQNFVAHLTNLGFDLNYEGLDIDTIDNTADWKERTKKSVELVDKHYADLPDIWNINQHRLIHNQQWFKSQELKNKLFEDVKDLL